MKSSICPDILGKAKKLYGIPRSGNCGIMVLDNSKLIKNSFFDKCMSILRINNYGIHDQDVINLYCRGKYDELEKQYNIFLDWDAHIIDKYNDYIFHFAGSDKPYKKNIGKYQSLWDKYKI